MGAIQLAFNAPQTDPAYSEVPHFPVEASEPDAFSAGGLHPGVTPARQQ